MPPKSTPLAVRALPVLVVVGALAGCSSSGSPGAHGGGSSTSESSGTASSGASSSAPASPAASGSPSTSTGASSPTAPAPSASSATTPASTAAGPPPCATAHLALSQGRTEGAAGSTYVTYWLRNTGADACVLDGHPGFALLRADGSVIQHPAERTGAVGPVRVAPGHRAHFVVRTSDPGTVPAGECSWAWRTAQVQVYPPDQTTAIRQPSDVQACDLVVSAVS